MASTVRCVLVVMGVSGSGKTTLARALSARLGWAFQEGDDLHPAANIAKMHAGYPLDDADRAPWLAAVARWIDGQLAAGQPGVIACSALRHRYRDALRADGVAFVHLDAAPAAISQRLAHREGHFMPPGLLGSQVETLEPPGPDERAVIVDAMLPIEQQVDAVVAWLAPLDEPAPRD